MNRLQVASMVVGMMAMLALLSTATRHGLRFDFAFPLNPIQIAAFAAMSAAAALSSADFAWKALSTGIVAHQRTPDGVAISRPETPTFFWIYVVVFVMLTVSFLWLAAHVIGYGLGWWGWSIEI